MKKFVVYTVKIMLVAERLTNRNYSNQLYLLTFYILFMVIGAIMGSIIFISVRLEFISTEYARNTIVPFVILFTTAIPLFTILFYKKKVNVEILKEKIAGYSIIEAKRERTKGVIWVLLSSCSILIALTILSVLIKFSFI